MKRILFFDSSTTGKVGGSHHSLLLLAKNLDPSRFETIVVLNSDNALRSEFESVCKRVIVWDGPCAAHFAGQGEREGWHLKFRSWPGPLSSVFNSHYRLAKAVYNDGIRGGLVVKRYLSLIKKERIDLLHLNNSFDPYWIIAARIARIPVVQHIRGIAGTNYSPFCHWPERVICISDDIRNEVIRRGISPRKVVRIYNAVDTSGFQAKKDPNVVRSELGINQSHSIISIFGNIQRWKGQDTLLKACSRLKEKYSAILCVVFGEIIQDDYFGELKRLAISEGMEDRFLVAGYRSDVADCMNISDIIVHASTQPEPFGRVIIEAMTLGRPIIGSKIGAVPEIIEHKISGLLFEPGDDEELARLIDSLLSDPDEADLLGRSAVKRVRQVFDVKQHIALIENTYEDVLSKSG